MFDADFPIIDNYRSRGVYYFDSASTTLKLKGVIEAVNSFFRESNKAFARKLRSFRRQSFYHSYSTRKRLCAVHSKFYSISIRTRPKRTAQRLSFAVSP